MMKVFAVCLALTATVAFATAPNDLELWFSTTSTVATPPAPENPVLDVGYSGKVYLWGRTQGSFQTINTSFPDGNGNPQPWTYTGWVGAIYQGISLDTTGAIGFAGTIVNPNAPTGYSPAARWLTQSDFGWATGDQFNVATLFDRGCGGAGDPAPGVTDTSKFDAQQSAQGGYVYTRLGSITISSAPAGASLFMTVGSGTIARRLGDPATDLTFMGIGDEGVHGPIVGATSTVADMTVAPEPASLLLLGLAGLALRRR